MVGHQVLVLSIEVRVLVPQLCKEANFVKKFLEQSWGTSNELNAHYVGLERKTSLQK